MEPIVLIHGYSAESEDPSLNRKSIREIYGDLPDALRDKYGKQAVVEIDVSRYVTLEDGVRVEDISRALDRALRDDEFKDLLKRKFHVIVHSTGALVIRNWIREYSRRPCPIGSLVYLAGANFGSGWAHVGSGQVAKWGRRVFQGGAERGIRVLEALELGSSWTLDLNLSFLDPQHDMKSRYGVLEHVVNGTEVDALWYLIPIRYAKEDGSDGVVRASAANLNFNYVSYGPTREARALPWSEARREQDRHDAPGRRKLKSYYSIRRTSRAGIDQRPVVPFAVTYETAHTGDDSGIVTGSGPRDQVLRLIDLALTSTPSTWSGRVQAFEKETLDTYRRVRERSAARGWIKKLIDKPQDQYDPHSQVVVRLRDQDGRPVEDFDIYFDSVAHSRDESLPLGDLIEDKHVNTRSPNVITFFLRSAKFREQLAAGQTEPWESRVPAVNGCYLEITARERETDEILYLPFRFEFGKKQLADWITPHATTVIDVELLRLPSPQVFQLKRFSG